MPNQRVKITDLPESDRPREKLRRNGPQALSDRELLAVLLGRGTEEMDVFTMADRILEVFGKAKECPLLEELEKIKGVGPARACLISAAVEFARRRIRPEGLKVTFPTDVLPLIQHYADRKQEHFLCVSLNGANEVIKARVVSVGTVDRTQVQPATYLLTLSMTGLPPSSWHTITRPAEWTRAKMILP